MKLWSFLTLVSGLLVLCVFNAVPRYFDYMERSYAMPAGLKGEYLIRNDSMGEGHFAASRSNRRTHNGIDLRSEYGAPVYAAKSGRVTFAGVQGGYGNYIRLDHPDGMNSRYAHLTEMLVRPGQWVWRHQVIGTIGNTGNADHPAILPHLHFEIRRQENPANPMNLLETAPSNPGSR